MACNSQDRGRRFDTIAMTVRNRDAGHCRRCEEPETDEKLSIHHIISDSKIPNEFDAHLPINLVSLCRKCHPKLESKSRDYQIRELNIENQKELMLSERERWNLNERLEKIGPRILNTKTISRKESEEYLKNNFTISKFQTILSEF